MATPHAEIALYSSAGLIFLLLSFTLFFKHRRQIMGVNLILLISWMLYTTCLIILRLTGFSTYPEWLKDILFAFYHIIVLVYFV